MNKLIKSQYVLVLIVFTIQIIIFITHFGITSPYSYLWAISKSFLPAIDGNHINPDAMSIYPFTRFFYSPSLPEFKDIPNTMLPIHSFVTSILMGLTRSYVFSCYLANLLSLWIFDLVLIKYCLDKKVAPGSLYVSVPTLCLLPFLAQYIGQPMQYIVGSMINFSIVFAILALLASHRFLSWQLGLLCAILTLNYDPYVYLGSISIFVAVEVYLNKSDFIQSVKILAIATIPKLLWTLYVQNSSAVSASTLNFDRFIKPSLEGWLRVIKNSPAQFPLIFGILHVGWIEAFKEIIAMIYWPVLISFFYLFLKLIRPISRISRTHKPTQFVCLLVVVFFVVQLLTAAFNWENNTRRVIPILFSFGYGYIFMVNRLFDTSRWKRIFVTLLAISGLLTFSDTIFRSPIIHFIHLEQSQGVNPRIFLNFSGAQLPTLIHSKIPTLLSEGKAIWNPQYAAEFLALQMLFGLLIYFLFWVLVDLKLIPRSYLTLYVGFTSLSLVSRFI